MPTKQNLFLILWVVLCLTACRSGVEQGSTNEVHVSGRIEGDEAMISSNVPGRVSTVEAREGDHVSEGDELIRIGSNQILARRDQGAAMVEVGQRQLDRAKIRLPLLDEKIRQLILRKEQAEIEAAGRVANAKGQLAAARANLARAESELVQAQADSKRLTSLAAREAVPEQLAEQQRTNREVRASVVRAAQEQVAAAEGALEATRASKTNSAILEAERVATQHEIRDAQSAILAAASEVQAVEALAAQSQADADDLVIRAPFEGLIVTRAAEPGQVVTPGQTLLTLVDPSALYLRAFVSEALIHRVRVGQAAEVFLDGAPDRALGAVVMRIDPQAMFTPENTYFREDRVRQVVGVKLLLKDDSGSAKLGMSAEGRILIESSE